MPITDWNDSAVWNALYSGCSNEEEQFVRDSKDIIMCNAHWRLKDALDIKPSESIVLIGAAYGWIAEDWIQFGLGPVVAVDISTYIQTRKHMHAVVPIINENILTESGLEAIRSVLGGNGIMADWVISEDLLPMLTDQECLDMGREMRKLGKNVAHWVTTKSPGNVEWPPMNWKTLEEYKNLMSPDAIVKRGSDKIA